MEITAFYIIVCGYAASEPGRTLIGAGDEMNGDPDGQHCRNGDQTSSAADSVNDSGEEERKTAQETLYTKKIKAHWFECSGENKLK